MANTRTKAIVGKRSVAKKVAKRSVAKQVAKRPVAKKVGKRSVAKRPGRRAELPIIQPKASGRLVLGRLEFRKNVAQLFDKVAQSDKLREQFIANPTKVLTQRVLGRKVPAQQLSEANRFLFAMIANDKFRAWMEDYAVRHRGQRVNQEQFGRDLAVAIADLGDDDIVYGLLRNASLQYGIPGWPGTIMEQCVTGPKQSVCTPPATPSTSDQTLKSSQNFNGIGFGDERYFDVAVMRSVVEQMIEHAKSLAEAGALAQAGARFR